jgi:hypothetical protein
MPSPSTTLQEPPMSKQANQTTQSIETLLERIALDHLFIETLETRHSDRMDFHEVSVWGVKSALMAAYEAGRQAAKQG